MAVRRTRRTHRPIYPLTRARVCVSGIYGKFVRSVRHGLGAGPER